MNESLRSLRKTFRLVVAALLLVVATTAAAVTQPVVPATFVGTLKVERHGNQGRPVILVPGLQGGSWVWHRTIEQLQNNHVVYAVTLAGFDGVPAPAGNGSLLDRADASLLQLVQQIKAHDTSDKPVLVGHSLGGTLSLRFVGEHPELVAGVVAVDGLPVFPGMERLDSAQRQAMAERTGQQMAAATTEQFAAQALGYMQKMGVIDPGLAAHYAPMNARSDIKASARYMAEDLAADYRPGLKHANVPILEISPYYAPDFSQPPLVMNEARKAAYYQSLLSNAPKATVVSISPSRHYVMLDQPGKFQQVLADFLTSLEESE